MAIAMSSSDPNPIPGGGVLGGGNLVRSGSRFAKKAKAALRRDKKDDEGTDLKVYVAREMRVVETSVRGGSSVEAARPGINRQEWTDPSSPTGPMSPGSPTDTLDQRFEEEDGARRTRRQQLAKVNEISSFSHAPKSYSIRVCAMLILPAVAPTARCADPCVPRHPRYEL
jgi:hypothetical protein